MVGPDGNGGEMEMRLRRKDYIGLAALITSITTAVVGATVALLLMVFQSRAEAIQEHAAIEQKIAVEQAIANERQLRHDDNDKAIKQQVNAVVESARVMHENQQRIMWKIGTRPKPLPASMAVDLDDEEGD